MKTFYAEPEEIQIPEDRIREEMGNVQDLADSIAELDQVVPIVITSIKESELYILIDGGRRLAACILLKKKVFCVLKLDIDTQQMKVLEYVCNFKRKQFTPAEELEGLKQIHEMQQKLKGKGGRGNTGWKAADTGKLLGISHKTVNKKLLLAAQIEQMPQLKALKSEKDIKRGVKRILNVVKRGVAADRYAKNKEGAIDIHLKDAEDLLASTPDASIDLVLTDPPYGIDLKIKGVIAPGGFKFDDSFKKVILLCEWLSKETYRITKETGQALIFFAPEYFEIVKRSFEAAGWLSNQRPIIWIKGKSGSTNQADKWLASCYEMILYFRKEKSGLNLEGRPDWMQYDPIRGDSKIHPAEKPVPLLRELIRITSLPSHRIIDPYMGSGATIQAAIEEKLIPRGCDNSEECYKMTLHRLDEMEKKDA